MRHNRPLDILWLSALGYTVWEFCFHRCHACLRKKLTWKGLTHLKEILDDRFQYQEILDNYWLHLFHECTPHLQSSSPQNNYDVDDPSDSRHCLHPMTPIPWELCSGSLMPKTSSILHKDDVLFSLSVINPDQTTRYRAPSHVFTMNAKTLRKLYYFKN